MADGLLWLLNGGGCHAQVFTDDFAAVAVSSDLNAAVNLMQCMLKKVTIWCLETGLKVNLDKTELVIFTRKHKAKKRLEPKNSAKYLGVILDKKSLFGMNTWTRGSGSFMRLSGYVVRHLEGGLGGLVAQHRACICH